MGFRVSLAAVLGLVLAACASQPPPAPKPLPGGPVFNPVLSGAGTWDEIEGIGTVWMPAPRVVGPGFTPYVSAGRWAWTEEGWVFVSEHSWGWATFHYGRWLYQTTYGWMWTPGTTWAPNWVDWRYGKGYVSWMPTPPAGAYAKERWQIVEARHFLERELMPRSVPETPALTAGLTKPQASTPALPLPPKEFVAAAVGRPVTEPTKAEARRIETAKNAFPRPAPPAPKTAPQPAETAPAAVAAAPSPVPDAETATVAETQDDGERSKGRRHKAKKKAVKKPKPRRHR